MEPIITYHPQTRREDNYGWFDAVDPGYNTIKEAIDDLTSWPLVYKDRDFRVVRRTLTEDIMYTQPSSPMTSQDLIDLAHANLKAFNKTWWNEDESDPDYTCLDMLAFHKQGIREGMKLILDKVTEYQYTYFADPPPVFFQEFKDLI